ncbi:MAG TPA: DUF1015 domain-containing protein [Solirubrobacteraceae bacterium]|jgi:uncharacterized protein (DUF1015 family)|nr:DUF1015 domain-containing protein [Solirubrobacteraceae bacterium]
MADVQPLRALHYDPAVVGALSNMVAPPYDVIDATQRAALLARSPFNVVAVDLPQPTPDTPDQYRAAGDLFESWQLQGAVTRDAEPAVWAHTQDYKGPDGVPRTRRGFFCRVRIEDYGAGRVRPHERTHPGPKEDRLRLTRATRANVSPIFSLYSDPADAAWRALSPTTDQQPPWADVTDADGTVHRLWRVADPEAIAAVQAATRDAELLIADGHHRYETMQAYAQEVGGDGEHRYILMCLVALEDPGLTVFPTHRLIGGLDDAQREGLDQALERDFEIVEVTPEEIAPPDGEGPLQMGFFDGRTGRALRLTIKDQAIADAALPGRSEAYRHLDTGVLETLILKNALGYSDEDIAHFNGLFYARDTAEALEMVRSGDYDAAFVMRPTPVGQVRDVAAAGENMPPKSTYFFPKLLTGLLFNPLV